MNRRIEIEPAEAVGEGQEIGLHIHQFVGLVWLLRFNASMAADVGDVERQQWGAMNALLCCFAALEALILETAIILRPGLYRQREWRRSGLVEKFLVYLRDADREHEPVPEFVAQIAELRIALTHSEPDNPRIVRLNESIARLDAAHYVERVRQVAHFLWQGDGPRHFAGAF